MQVKFRNAAAGKPMENYFNNGGSVAFSRGNVAFFAMSKDGKIDENLQTGNKQVSKFEWGNMI